MTMGDANNFDHEKEQIMNSATRTQRIKELNDQFRRTGFGGRQFITPGIQEMGLPAVLTIRQLFARYDAFCEDNDPYGEHDFGSVKLSSGEKIFWKIDYYADDTFSAGAEDPADPAKSWRVLTIMLAEEY